MCEWVSAWACEWRGMKACALVHAVAFADLCLHARVWLCSDSKVALSDGALCDWPWYLRWESCGLYAWNCGQHCRRLARIETSQKTAHKVCFFEFYFMRTCFPQPGWTSSGKVCKAPLSYAGILSSCSMVQPICGYQIVQGPCSAIMRVAEFNADMKRGLEQKCSVQCMHALVFCRFLFAYSCLEKGHAKMLARRTTRLHARRGGWTWVMVSHFRGKLMLNWIECA